MRVRSWQIFYREIDRYGNITFRGTLPVKVLTEENKARKHFNHLKKKAAAHQMYEMVQVSHTGEVEFTESSMLEG